MTDILANLREVGRLSSAVANAASAAEDADAVADAGRVKAAAGKLHDYVENLDVGQSQDMDLQVLRHKLRTPINQIIGYCELMLEESEDAGGAVWEPQLREIHEHAEELTVEVDKLLDRPARSRARAHTPFAGASEGGDAPESDAAVILLVDDNPENRDMLARRLRRDGHYVVEAEDGAKALEIAANVELDLVLLDIMMPVMDGYETLAAMKKDERLQHTPVIMLTSLDETDSVTRCIKLGAEDHLPKPFDPVLLRARIGASLEKKRLHDREISFQRQVLQEKKRADDLLTVVIPLGVALSAEPEYERLLERLVGETRRLCHADAGALFLRHPDASLHCVFQEYESLGIVQRGTDADSSQMNLDDATESLDPVASAMLTGRAQNVGNVSALDPAVAARTRAFDQANDYVTRSMLAVPLTAASGEVVGVLELVNARDLRHGAHAPFDSGLEQLVVSMSALAGAALENYARVERLKARIQSLEIQVDAKKQEAQVAEITETDYFRSLRDKARALRKATPEGGKG